MTACSTAMVGQALAWGTWLFLFGGLAVLLRRQQLAKRRDASRRHAAAMAALRRHHPSTAPLPTHPRASISRLHPHPSKERN